MILHIPHASRAVPLDVRPQFLLGTVELEQELTRMTDAFTDDLFDFPGATRVQFGVSRLVVDVERFRDDRLEPMSSVGMGAVYVRTSHGIALRGPLDASAREQLLQRFYDPHHHQLAEAVADQLAHGRRPQIVDCHSFPSRALPCDRDQRADRPDFCIGTDGYHTDADLVSKLRDCLESRGFTVGIDWPYAGALVPNGFYQRDARVRAVMVEVNRGLYMNEATGEAIARFAATREVVRSLLHLIDTHEREADKPPA